MPPKSKAGKKDGVAKLCDKENLARAEAEILSLQRLLELRSNEAVEARRSEKLWRERMDAFQAALTQQKEDTIDITADMLRQYKAMQEQMLKKIADLENENSTMKRSLQEKDTAIDKLNGEITAIRKGCDAELLDCQRKMEDMQLDFTTMLRETLDKMHDRLAGVPTCT